jgi:hypothetical protein
LEPERLLKFGVPQFRLQAVLRAHRLYSTIPPPSRLKGGTPNAWLALGRLFSRLLLFTKLNTLSDGHF